MVGEQIHDLSLSACHQILCTDDGNVLCVNTGNNSVLVYNPTTRKISKVLSISGPKFDRFDPSGELGDHLNSLYLHADKLYVLAHGHTRFSQLGIFSYPGLELEEVRVLKYRSGLHNLFLTEKNELVSCNSTGSSLVNLHTNQDIWFAPSHVHGFLKGLAIADEFMFVGGSRFSPRDVRTASETTIWVINKENFKTLAHFDLGDFGPVQEIRVASHRDIAHNASILNGIYNALFASGKRMDTANVLEFYGKSSAPSGNLNICTKFTRYRGMGIFDLDGKLNTKDYPDIWIAKNQPQQNQHKIFLPKVEIQYRFTEANGTCFFLLSTNESDRLEKYYLVGIVSGENPAFELWEINGKLTSLIASHQHRATEFGQLSFNVTAQDFLIKLSNTETSYFEEWSIKDLVDYDSTLAYTIGFQIANTSIDFVDISWHELDISHKPKNKKSKKSSQLKRDVFRVNELKKGVNQQNKGKAN
jgi:hypothetical protein